MRKLWWFGIEETHLWRRVVISKFREEWGVSTKPVPGIHGCGLWKSIRMGCQLCTLRLVLVTRFAFGIWHDCWCGDQSLRVVFLVLYDNFRDRDASMASLLVRSSMGERQSWHSRFLQDFNDLELDLVASFLRLLESHIPITEDGDKVKWRLKKNEEFDIRSLYNAKGFYFCPSLERHMESEGPPKVSFFIWMVAWGKILTCENFMKRGYTVDRCYMSRCSGYIIGKSD